jgi:ketosteroid isomerase-like protein
VRNAAAPAALAISRELAVARAAYEALRSGDVPGVGSYFADDVVWEAPNTLPAAGVIPGRDAVLEQ